jgi:hypothetical protein
MVAVTVTVVVDPFAGTCMLGSELVLKRFGKGGFEVEAGAWIP